MSYGIFLFLVLKQGKKIKKIKDIKATKQHEIVVYIVVDK